MSSQHTFFLAAALAASLSGWSNPAAIAANPMKGWAVIFAPSGYSELQEVPHLHRGGLALRQQMIAGGFDKSRIVTLESPDATAKNAATAKNLRRVIEAVVNRIEEDELLLVALASHALQIDGRDVVCGSDSRANDLLNPSAIDEGPFVDLQALVKKMAKSKSRQQFLIIDNARNQSPLAKELHQDRISEQVRRFGNQALKVSNNQWILANRTGRLSTNGGQLHSKTVFVTHLIDGLAQHADGNRDRSVSAFELTEYMQMSAEVGGFTPPILYGKANHDFPLLSTSRRTPAQESRFTKTFRSQLTDRMVAAAKTALLIEGNAEQALQSLDRALLYCVAPECRYEIEGLRLTALAMTGRADEAWEQASAQERPLYLVINTESWIYQNSEATGQWVNRYVGRGRFARTIREWQSTDWTYGTVPAGTILKVVEGADSRLRFEEAFQLKRVGQEFVESGVELNRGWVAIDENSVTESTSLAATLREYYQLSE